ncbi:MAG: hypothetical protein P8J27_06535 [Mariniblastus sp.]|nr:hypothetical protein [Mariniblastus sp.]
MLLPSDELKELNKRIPICLSGKELPASCDIRYGQFFYFFTFNENGELTDVCNFSSELAKRKKEGASLPNAFVDMVEESLTIETSLASSERAYLVSEGSQGTFEQLKSKLAELELIGSMRVVRLLRQNADKMSSPALTRFRALSLEIDAVSKQVINKAAIDSLALSIEDFLAAHPNYEAAEELIGSYLKVALKFTFDVSGRCQKVSDRWRKFAKKEDQRAAQALADKLTILCEKQLKDVSDRIDQLKSDKSFEAPRLYAQVGNAQKTLESLDKTASFGVMRPIHKSWREKATAKVRQ